MPSADPGAPAVRPADVERWLADLGLEPVERADREGITSWDLVLDGRRRFDLRVTVILDPTLAVIVWAHYAPPINDMFRKSYRSLLRWNDEFPFAKFSVGEDERPAARGRAAAIADVDARPAGAGARPRSSGSPIGCSTSPSTGSGSVGGDPTRADRTGRNEPLLTRYRRGCGAPRPDDTCRADPLRLVAPARDRDRSRRPASSSRRGADEVRAATPDLTIVSRARYAVQPDEQRVRVTVNLTLTNHLTDTKTRRYYFDRAYLAVLPGTRAIA